MLPIIAKIGLFFSQPLTLFTIIVLGLLSFDRKIFARTLLLLLFTMIYNVYLKALWHMPLPAHMEGWAFPSGHMHGAFVFWGWLAVEYRKFWFSALVFLILCFVGYGLVYSGFHYPIDILGAAFFGSLSILGYYFLNKISYFKEKPERLGFFFIILASILIVLLTPFERKPHMWKAYYGLIAFSCGWWLLRLCGHRFFRHHQ